MIEELSDKGCIKVKNKEGKIINVCVGTEEDMGKRSISLIKDDGVKTYARRTSAIKTLRKEKVSQEGITKATRFISNAFRDSVHRKSGIGGGIGLQGLGRIDGKRYEETQTE